MRRKSYIALHKNEWDRLCRRKDDDRHQQFDQREAYFKRLTEISEGWVKKWPDTVQGHVEKVKKQKQRQKHEEIELVKNFLKNRKEDGTKGAIKKAKQQIFENSCHGKQLISALLESKTLEERDAQIEFQKKLKKMSEDEEKEALSKLNLNRCSFELDKNEDDEKRKKREMEIELAKINQSIYEMELCKKNKEKKEQERLDLDNALLMQELLVNEAKQEKEYSTYLRKDIALYEKEHNLAKERRVQWEKLEEEIANANRKELDERYCKIRRVLKAMHHDNHNTERYKQTYNLVKEVQEQEEQRYNEFIQKGIKKLEDRTKINDQEEAQTQKLEREKNKIISNFNKTEADRVETCRLAWKKLKCTITQRQCFMPKSCYRKKNACSALEEKQPTNFLVPAQKLREQLEARKKAPSPWTGVGAAHAHFAEQASSVLRDARYKHFARKVVDNYRRTNCLDATTLPVPNYD